MGFVIDSSTGSPLPQEAMRRIVEAVDAWRGTSEVWVVFHITPPYEVVSVETSQQAAQAAVGSNPDLSYYGPVTPRATASSFLTPLKTIGCLFLTQSGSVSSVVLLNANNEELARFGVNPIAQRSPNPTSDLEAIFLTPSSVDKFVMPYLTRVFGAEYAASKRADWISEGAQQGF